MKKPIYYYEEGHPHCDAYNLGPCCPPPPHPHPCPPPCPPPKPHYHGKVSVVGRTVLTVKYVDRHGHYQTFDIKDGETYEITAVSSTRGICTFAGRIVDFDERELLIDCAREGEAHIYNIPFKYIWDINDIDYVYEQDDPVLIRPLLEVIAKEWNDREELIIKPEPIPLEYHSKKVGDSNE